MQKKTDRRVRKTKSQLRMGLARLMKEKSIGEITVRELVDEVDINRSTFYLHYSDIPSLLREIGCALVGPHGDIGFIRQIEQLLEENSRDMLAEMFPEKLEEMKYFYSFCLNGCLGFVKTWLEDGADKSPEYAARLTFQMVVSSMKAFYETAEEPSENR